MKHIIGLSLFSFIVSATAIVYALFNVPEITPVYELVSTPQYVPAERIHCKMKKNSTAASVEIKQAVLNLQTKQFNWEFLTPDTDGAIALYFFSKDSNGTRYITSEQVNNKFSYNGALRYSSSYDWLNKRKSYDNLYVMVQFESEAENHSDDSRIYIEKVRPYFDPAKAIAVTIDYGE